MKEVKTQRRKCEGERRAEKNQRDTPTRARSESSRDITSGRGGRRSASAANRHRSPRPYADRTSMTMTPVAVIRIEPAQATRTRPAMRFLVMMMRGNPQRGADDHHHRWPQQIGQCRLAHRILRPDDNPSTHSRQCAPMFRSMKHLRLARLHARVAFAMPTAYVRRPTISDRSNTPEVIQPLIIASPPAPSADCHALSLQHRARRRSHADRVVVQSRARADLIETDVGGTAAAHCKVEVADFVH
jgi:hypothetical protein